MEGRNKGHGESLDSIDALRRRVPSIVRRINEDPALALRAAANPILALAEMGIKLSDRLQRDVELRLRFRPQQIERLAALRNDINRLADAEVNPDDPVALHKLLFERLKLPPLPRPQSVVVAQGTLARAEQTPAIERHELAHPWVQPGAVKRPDPLERLREAHAVVPPLIEYRAIQASQPPLASADAFARLARGDVKIPKFRISARLQSDAPPQ